MLILFQKMKNMPKIKIKNNKNNKNKYCPFLEKKVSINLSTTFNNMPKNDLRQKKK